MEANCQWISGAKGQRFESSRAYHLIKHLGASSNPFEGSATPIQNRILDDSDSLVTRAGKMSTPEVRS
jgi:hypothetical protein